MKSPGWWSVLRLLGSVGLLGCSSDNDGDGGGTAGGGADLPAIECDGDSPAYEEVALFGTCVLCHASTRAAGLARSTAPVGVDFDSEAAAQESAIKAVEQVYQGTMPPAGEPPTEAEKAALYEWALCSD